MIVEGRGVVRRPAPSLPRLAGVLLGAQMIACGSTSEPAPLDEGELSPVTVDAGGSVGNGSETGTTADGAVPFAFDTARFEHVASALTTSYVIRPDGTLHGWGGAAMGELFEYDQAQSMGALTPLPPVAQPEALGTDGDWQHITAAGEHACGLRSGGRLFCWGDGVFGEAGPAAGTVFTLDGGGSLATPTAYAPAAVAGTWTFVVAGAWHTCALASDGTAWCWGRNDIGQVGDGKGSGTTVPTGDPHPVVGGAQWKTLAAGFGDTCGVQIDGSLWCWGDDDYGQLGAVVPSSLATSAGMPKSDYGPTGNGASAPVRVGARDDWDLVAIGYGEACASAGAQLFCWGGDAAAEVVEPRADGLPIGAILFATATTGARWAHVAVSVDHVLAVDSCGAMYTAPAATSVGQVSPGTLSFAPATFAEVASTYDTACALGNDATQKVYCWGHGDDDSLGLGDDAGARSAPTEVLPF